MVYVEYFWQLKFKIWLGGEFCRSGTMYFPKACMSYYGKISVGWWAGSVAGPIDSNQKLWPEEWVSVIRMSNGQKGQNQGQDQGEIEG